MSEELKYTIISTSLYPFKLLLRGIEWKSNIFFAICICIYIPSWFQAKGKFYVFGVKRLKAFVFRAPVALFTTELLALVG